MTDPRLWPLAAWCDRKPHVRWPLVILAIAVLWGLAGGIETAGP